MKLKTLKLHANFWIIGGTLAFFILAYFFYLKSYVPDQESDIISTRFRVLDQLGKNLNAKIDSYKGNVNELKYKIKDKADSLDNLFKKYNYEVPREEIFPYIYDGLMKGIWQYLNNDLQVINYKLDLGKSAPADQGNIEHFKTETDKFFYFQPLVIDLESTVGGDNEIFHDSILVGVNYEDILKGLKREDVFDGMFIIRNGEFVFSSLKSDMLIEKTDKNQDILDLLFTHQEAAKTGEKEVINQAGPKLGLPERMISGEYSDITISNKDYKLFFKPVKVEGEYWFLGGLMEVGHFDAAGRSIPQRVIIILSWILILIMLGLPLIKLKIISKTDHLKTGTIISSALSVLLGTSVLTLFLLYIAQNSLRLQNTDKRLKAMSAEIESTFTGEMTDAFRQLKLIDTSYNVFETGYDSNILNLPISNRARPNIYPFADYIFWANNEGIQSTVLTPFKETKSEPLNVQKREYYKNKDEWFFPPDTTEKFRLESILSIRTGDYKVGMSTTSKVQNNPVIALSSRFYSLIDPIIPKNFGFCIIDESGEVWFHSIKYRNTMENFKDECNDNPYLKAALYNRTSTPIDITYYNTPHRAFIKPMNQLPLYLVTFYDWNAETSFQAEVFTTSIIFIVFFFMFILLQVTILLHLERRFQWKLTKNLILKITRPIAHLNEHNRFLALVYLVVAFVTAIMVHFLGKIQAFSLLCMVEAIMFVFSYRVLNDNEQKTKQIRWFTGINIVILIFINIVLALLVELVDLLLPLAYELLLILLLYRAYSSFKHKSKDSEFPGHKIFVRNYVLFLIAISVLFAILPTMLFYEISYNKESEIRLRHYQVDLMKKREDRNAQWNKFYAPLIDSDNSKSVLQDRKNRGIYTSFYSGLTFSQDSIAPLDKENDIRQGSVFDSIFFFLRPFYDNEIVEDKFMVYGTQNNGQKQWTYYDRDSLALIYVSNTEDPKFEHQKVMSIAGRMEKFSFLMPFHHKAFTNLKGFANNSFFWLILLAILLIFYYLVRFGVRNIYSLDIVANFTHEPFGKLIRHQFLASKNIFIIKLSPQDETQPLHNIIPLDLQLDWSDKEIIAISESSIANCLADCQSRQIQAAGSDSELEPKTAVETKTNDYITIFIDHFDWDYIKPEILQEKLQIILKFINHKNIHWIVESNEIPSKIIADYQEIINFNKNIPPDDTTTLRVDLAMYKKILNDLHQFTNNIKIIQLPVKCGSTGEMEADPCGNPVKKDDLLDLIQEELHSCDYLVRFEPFINAYYEDNIKNGDCENPERLIIDKINTLAESYYEDLFNSCSPEEQYVMLDLADDQIMNQKNSLVIFGLLEKGIFVKNCDQISFMNVSFRKYIISQKSKMDTTELETKIGKKTGTWQGYRIMFIVIIVSLFIFISMANQDFLKNLQQVFVVIGGAIAAISGVLGLLSRNTKAPAK